MATQQEINTLLELLSTLPNCPITTTETRDLVRSMYFAALGDIPFQWLQAAYLQYIGQDKPFFPANPGTLREIAFDLEMTAQGVPTASQAWAMLMTARFATSTKKCDSAQSLLDDYESAMKRHDGNSANSIFKQYDKHVDTCPVCVWNAKGVYIYDHPVVTEVIRLMGGLDTIFTNNPSSDRARFLESYKELVALERRKLQMHPKVAELIGDPDRPRIGQAAEGMRLLAGQMGGTP